MVFDAVMHVISDLLYSLCLSFASVKNAYHVSYGEDGFTVKSFV
jgi:hypothetical protein